MSVFQQPSSEQLAAFVEGDPVAIDQVVQLILTPIVRWAFGQYSSVPEQEVASVVHQVLAEICVHPERYDPSRAQITTYVIHLVKLRINDVLREHLEIQNHEDWSEEAHEEFDRLPYNEVENIITESTRDKFFQGVSERLSSVEREFLNLLRSGEKSSGVLANVIRKHMTVIDAAKEVKNMRERLIRKLKAYAEETHVNLEDLVD